MKDVKSKQAASGKPSADDIISTLRSKDNVGNAKKGVNLLNIVQKLTLKREKSSEGESPDKSTG